MSLGLMAITRYQWLCSQMGNTTKFFSNRFTFLVHPLTLACFFWAELSPASWTSLSLALWVEVSRL